MDGGAKGLIINSQDLCKSSRKGKLNMKGQNGKQFKNNKFDDQGELRQEEEVTATAE